MAAIWSSGVQTTLAGPYSVAAGINNAGQVVRYKTDASVQIQATVWTDGIPNQLGSLGGPSSVAFDINNLGQVVGWGSISVASQHASIWKGTTITDLGSLGGNSLAASINDFGVIMGNSLVSGDFSHATLWNGNSIPVDLNNLMDSSGIGWTLTSANGVNNLGYIVGSGYNSLGQQKGFLLTPCESFTTLPWSGVAPVPGPLVCGGLPGLVFAGAILAWWRRKELTSFSL
ncbi:hypothetical protein [Bradyrhizobium sp. CB3481]|uniref:hypothetical protein n=1 Tax=Bradyrhizobium sp. CB3481 TaxID=3039158 RepID=UPI0024B1272F|nr:hypothetical protein [Bradyrhizobium sp. CB3481]WFU14388.1 hypothetical protein QA643_24695 [Bradyrhizobium sp. CB3481]